MNRREFFRAATAASVGTALGGCAGLSGEGHASVEPVIDIHQHTNYSGRNNDALIAHQKKMGVTHTVLLPAGRYFGLEVGAGGNETVVQLSRKLPRRFSYFANEVPFVAEPENEIKKYLRQGAIGIGEQKFQIDCDSPDFQRIAALAAEFNVPVLIHFQHDRYNTSFERFHQVL